MRSPRAATRESPHAATKTQHSQKKKKKKLSGLLLVIFTPPLLSQAGLLCHGQHSAYAQKERQDQLGGLGPSCEIKLDHLEGPKPLVMGLQVISPLEAGIKS